MNMFDSLKDNCYFRLQVLITVAHRLIELKETRIGHEPLHLVRSLYAKFKSAGFITMLLASLIISQTAIMISSFIDRRCASSSLHSVFRSAQILGIPDMTIFCLLPACSS